MPNKLMLNAYDRHLEAETDAGIRAVFSRRDREAMEARKYATLELAEREAEQEMLMHRKAAKCTAAARGIANACAGGIGSLTILSMARQDWRSVAIGMALAALILLCKEVLMHD